LTEPHYFKGALLDMLSIRNTIGSLIDRPAVLRKDFIFDKYQIDEARVYGADSLLLIVAMLVDKERGSSLLKELYDYSISKGMEPLVEVNNAEEMKIALDLGSKVIGVNNRDLHTFKVDMETTDRMMEVVEKYFSSSDNSSKTRPILCALSGISARSEVIHYASKGVQGVLVGESLMKAKDRKQFVKDLLGISSSTDNVKLTGSSTPMVKICGIKSVEAAICAKESGADFIGLMFVESSKRKVSKEIAKSIIEAIRSSPPSPSSQSSLTERNRSTSWFSLQSRRLRNHPRKPLIVGVFQNPKLEYVIEMVDSLGLDIVQFHGNEPNEWIHLIGVPVIKAFHVGKSTSLEILSEATRPGLFSIPLLDTALPNDQSLSGGTGLSFDWSIASRLGELNVSKGYEEVLPFLLAGGLNSTNVGEAIKQTNCLGVDVSGGVETNGEKDLEKIKEFIKAAKGV
jgi:anthranilate synthase / indole-3-glycerol phosphate synthase / phosphoribosylanthranilate isomerase